MQDRESGIRKDEIDNTLTIRIDGPYFPYDKFIKALSNFFHILEAIDKETSTDGKSTIDWSISTLKAGSISLEAKGSPKNQATGFERTSEVIYTFASGFESLRHSPDNPPGFSKEAMRYAKGFVDLIDPNDFAELGFSSKGWRLPDIHEVADNLLNKPIETYSFWGAVEGKLVSLNVEGRAKFGIRSPLQKSIIKCFVDNEKLFKTAKSAIGERVYVYGKIRQVLDGQKVNITASEIKIFSIESEAPSSGDILRRLGG
jgi:hypothetical protein